MTLTFRSIQLVVSVAVVTVAAHFAEANSGYRKTLLQWSYGTSFEGGPDVYEPLVTDRPDFTESAVTVGYGVVQLESGYTFTYNSDNGQRSRGHSFPETLLRVGALAEWLEFRFDWNYGSVEDEVGVISDTFTGAEDLGLGIKLALTPQECILPETAIILQMSVPTGSEEFTADEVLPGVNYLYSWEINDQWTTAGSTALNRAVDDVTGDAYTEFAQSWVFGRSWSDRLGSYAEWFVIVPSSADTVSTEHFFNGGFTWLFNNDFQWDIRAGVGLNDNADDFFAGSGFSYRYW